MAADLLLLLDDVSEELLEDIWLPAGTVWSDAPSCASLTVTISTGCSFSEQDPELAWDSEVELLELLELLDLLLEPLDLLLVSEQELLM